MDGDDERIDRLGHVINERKRALIEGGHLVDSGLGGDDDTPYGVGVAGREVGTRSGKEMIHVLCGYEDIEWKDLEHVVAHIVKSNLELLAHTEDLPGAMISLWLDGLFTGMLLERFRVEDKAKAEAE